MKGCLKKMTFWRLMAVVALAAGLYATVIRLVRGLGGSTNLSDDFPWGIWIGFDVMVGVGLAAGGFTITAAVHLFNLERFKPILRPTVLTAFLGYLMVIVGLLYDLGRPYRIWHPLIMWNPHSVMFEVGWCVSLYTTVLFLEFSPMLLERLKWHTPLRLIRGITIPLVVFGVLLSTLHQSSLGTLYVIVPDKMHGLWYSPLLPVYFFVSAIAAGLSMVIVESFLSSRAFGRRLELGLLQDIGRVIVVVLALQFIVRMQDLWGRNVLSLALVPGTESFLFLVEVMFGTVVPMILLALPSFRRDRKGLFCSALLVVLGFVLNRMNVTLTGMQGRAGASYFPSPFELAVTAMLVAIGVIAFALAVKHLKVFPEGEEQTVPSSALVPEPSVTCVSHGVLAAFGGVLALGAVYLEFGPTGSNLPMVRSRSVQTLPDVELQLPPELKFLPGPKSPGVVTFSHESHVVPEKPDCTGCHAEAYAMLKLKINSPQTPPGKRLHERDRCGKCHNGRVVFSVDSEESCTDCHARK